MRQLHPERAIAKALASNSPDAGPMLFAILCRHYGVSVPGSDEITATIVDEKLVLSCGCKSFDLNPHLLGRFSLQTAIDVLLKPVEEPNPKC